MIVLDADETAEANGLLDIPARVKRSADDDPDIQLPAKVPKREDIMHNWNGIIEIIDDAEYFLPSKLYSGLRTRHLANQGGDEGYEQCCDVLWRTHETGDTE